MKRLGTTIVALAVSAGACTGLALADTFVGTPGADTLQGTRGPDQLYGEDGDDHIAGLARTTTSRAGRAPTRSTAAPATTS